MPIDPSQVQWDEQPQQPQAAAALDPAKVQWDPPKKKGFIDETVEGILRDAPGARGKLARGEAALSMLTGAAAAIPAGYAGALTGLENLAGIDTGKTAAQAVEETERKYTYQPRTTGGAGVTRAISYLPEKYSAGTTWLGEKAEDIAAYVPEYQQSAPAIGTLVKAGGEMLPALFGARGRGVGAAGRAGGAAEAEAAAAARARAQAAVDRSADQAAAQAAKDPEAPKPLRWADMSAEVQDKFTQAAHDQTTFDKLSPEATQRAARLESQGMPYTRGQVERSTRELGKEALLERTEAGQKLVDIRNEQTRQLNQSLDDAVGRLRGQATSAEGAGAKVIENLKTQEKASAQRVKDLYDHARDTGQAEARISSQPVFDLINNIDNPAHLDYIGNKLQRMGMAEKDANGNWVPKGDKTISLNQLDEIYKAASAEGKADATKAHYAREVKNRINEITEGAGGDAYRAARQARLEHAKTFDDPKIMDLLLDDTKGNRRVALENVWNQTVMRGSLADLRRVKQQLLTGRDKPAQSRQAWREMQSQTMQHIREVATKGPKDAAGRRPVSGANLRKVLNEIGDDKLNILFSKAQIRRLYRVADVAEDVTTAPRLPAGGQVPTAGLLTTMLDVATKIPVAGKFVEAGVGAVKLGKKLTAEGAAEGKVREALRGPLEKPSEKFSLREAYQKAREAARGPVGRLSIPTPQSDEPRPGVVFPLASTRSQQQ